MKIEARDADRFIASPPKNLRVALVFGPDAGLVQERAEALLKSVTPDLTDPFNVADFEEAAILADPARLSDEAAAMSMMGGRRVVRVLATGWRRCWKHSWMIHPVMRWWCWKRVTWPRAARFANCLKKMTRPPPWPVTWTMPAIWNRWCAMA